MKYGYGNFGNLSKHYLEARQGYPQEALDWFWTIVGKKDAEVLDLGCGTGISTRQLAEEGEGIIGCDSNGEMIETAKNSGDGLEYLVAKAEKLPFEDKRFDAVAAFGAFHWFANEKALSEIQRILKLGGVFFVVNKNDTGDFKKGYKEIIKSVLQQDLPEVKKGYEPEKLLKESGFTDIQVKNFGTSEYFSPQQALEYLQSVSIWNLVPADLKLATLKLLEDFCRERVINGKIERKLNVKCIAGRAY